MATQPARTESVLYRGIGAGQLLGFLARDLPGHEALICPARSVRYDFQELEWMSRQIARGLLSLGIKRGDRVAIWAPNRPEWVVLQFAIAGISAIVVGLDTGLNQSDAEQRLRQTGATALVLVRSFGDAAYLDAINAIAPELAEAEDGRLSSARLPDLKTVVFIGEDHPPGTIRYDSLFDRAASVSEEQLLAAHAGQNPDDIAVIQYTAGATGAPKPVMLSHRSIVDNAADAGSELRLTAKDRVAVPVPFFRSFGGVLGVLGSYTHGAAIVPVEAFDPLRLLHLIADQGCTALLGVPGMFASALKQLDYHSVDLSGLRTGIMGGASCPEPLVRKIIEKIPELAVAYGLTEASPTISVTPVSDSLDLRSQTAGKPLPGIEVKIFDRISGRGCAAGMAGEVCCRGYNVMKGYFGDRDATDRAVDSDGWLHTGDLGTLDEGGYLRILGRL